MAITHHRPDEKATGASHTAETHHEHVHHEHVDLAEEVAIEAEGDGVLVPKGYWTSFRFLGSAIGIMLVAHNLFLGYLWPVNILNIIDADIGPHPMIYVVTLANTLIKGVLLLLVGSLSDVLGRRYFIIAGCVCGTVGAIIAATAQNIPTLIGAQVFMGAAGAIQVIYPLLVSEIVPNKWRGFAQGAITAAVFPTLGLGPAFARMLVQYTAPGWRSVYWLNVATNTTAAILFLVCYFPPNFEQIQSTHAVHVSRSQGLKQIDYVGFFLYGGGLACVLLALAWGGKTYAWNSAPVLSTLIIGILVLAAFGLYEVYMPLKSPLMPMKLFKIRNFNVFVIVGCVGQMSYYALNVLWPQHITNLYTTDNIMIGWMSCTTGASMAVGEIIFGPFCKKGCYIKYQMYASVVLLCIFCGIMSMGNEFRQSLAIAMTVFVGASVGWIELICIVCATLVIPAENIGSGSAFFASTRAVTGTISTSIYIAILNNKSSQLMNPTITDFATAAGLPSSSVSAMLSAVASKSAAALNAVPGMTDAVKAAIAAAQKDVMAKSYGTVYLSSLAFGGIALITCYFLKNDIDRYFTAFLNKSVDAAKAAEAERVARKEDPEKASATD